MKISIALSYFFLLPLIVVAQIDATTDDGEKVILFNDGTWEYANNQIEEIVNSSSLSSFNIPSTSNASVSGEKLPYEIWYNKSKWNVTEKPGNVPEYLFQLNGEDAYAQVIAERFKIPADTLAKVALENARSVSNDIKLHSRSERKVNGLNVVLQKYGGTVRGVPVIYYGYFYSFEGGSLQFICYTADNLFEEYKPELEKLINGLTTKENE